MKIELCNNSGTLTKIKVIGVGGAGGNAVNSMIKAHLSGVEFIVANTDAQSLHKSLADSKINLGAKLTKGLGAGGDPGIGRKAAEESIQEIEDLLKETDMIFLVAGMGGGTGTGAAPVIVQKARDMGVLTLAIVSLPFDYEGLPKKEKASEGVSGIQNIVDTLLVIPNNLIQKHYKQLSFLDAYGKANEVIANAARAVADMINFPALMNVDFADVKSAMKGMGYALMGSGEATGENRAVEAATEAITNKLLADVNLTGSKHILMNVTVSSSFMMSEFEQINEIVTGQTGNFTSIKSSIIIDDEMGDRIKVTIIATGLETSEAVKALPQSIVNAKLNNSTATQNFEQPTIENIYNQDEELSEVMNRIKGSENKRVIEIKIPTKESQVKDFELSDAPAFIKKYYN